MALELAFSLFIFYIACFIFLGKAGDFIAILGTAYFIYTYGF